jgi:hypothetical protein
MERSPPIQLGRITATSQSHIQVETACGSRQCLPSEQDFGALSTRQRVVFVPFRLGLVLGLVDDDGKLDEHLDRKRITLLLFDRQSQSVDLLTESVDRKRTEDPPHSTPFTTRLLDARTAHEHGLGMPRSKLDPSRTTTRLVKQGRLQPQTPRIGTRVSQHTTVDVIANRPGLTF